MFCSSFCFLFFFSGTMKIINQQPVLCKYVILAKNNKDTKQNINILTRFQVDPTKSSSKAILWIHFINSNLSTAAMSG